MKFLPEKIKDKIESEARKKVFQEFQQRLEQQGVIPKSPTFMLRKYGGLLRSMYEILIGTFIGGFTLFLVFWVVNELLHIE